MVDNSFEINGTKFKVRKVDAFKQFHIVRRLAPILSDLVPVAKKFENMTPEQLKGDQMEALKPILDGLAKLSDADSETVLYGLLSAVEILQPHGNYANVVNGKTLLFQDLDLPLLLQLAGRAFMFNLSGFFAELPKVS